jgi:ankyrin repeat protein
MKENEKHKHAFEGRVRCHYHSLEKCTGALNWACWKGAPDIAHMLLADPRVDPSAMNQYALRWASRFGHTEIVGMLLADPRVDPSANRLYALAWASWKGHTEMVNMLLADPRVKSVSPGIILLPPSKGLKWW